MALKNLDVSGIDEAISEAKAEEQRRQEAETAEKITAAIQIFVKKSPEIIQAMRGIVSCLDTQKFTSELNGGLKKSAADMARQFNERARPIVERMEKADRQVSIPVLTFGIIIISLVFLAAFLVLMIYANASTFHSGSLSWMIALVIVAWGVSVAIVTYLSRKS